MSSFLKNSVEAQRPLPRARPDLVLIPQTYEGRPYHILKDPISMQYLRLGEQERFVFGLLDGTRSLQEIAQAAAKQFPEVEYDPDQLPEQILRFLRQLGDKQFLQVSADSTLDAFHRRRQDRWKRAAAGVRSNLLCFRVPLWDPDALLTRMQPVFRFVWTRRFAGFCVALLLLAAWLVGLDAERLASATEDLFTAENLLLLWLSLILVKVVHEFGHGLACKNFGGEVHEMGILVLVFTPCLYCNTTDAWLMSKWRRISVAAAGIAVELFIASVAAVVWVLTQDGLPHQLAFVVMVWCSISTVLFNGNPLLKFDGYYVLSDAIEIPNLQQKAARQVLALLRRLLLGPSAPRMDLSELPLSPRRRWLFAAYAAGSYVYRWVVLYFILRWLSHLLQPAGLGPLLALLAMVVLFGGVVLPLVYCAVQIVREHRSQPSPQPLTRPLMVCGIFLAAVGLITLLPIPQTVVRSCALGSREGMVRAATPGFVREIVAPGGARVRTGQVIATLENPDLNVDIRQLEMDLAAADFQIRQQLARKTPLAMRGADAKRSQIEASLAKLRNDLNALVLRAPCDGTVEGFRLDEMIGRWLQPGQPLCQVIPSKSLQVIIPLDEREARLVRKDQSVSLRVHGWSGERFSGSVRFSPVAWLRQPPRSVREAKNKAAAAQEKPQLHDAPYEVELEIQNPDRLLRAGMTGRARVYCGYTTLAQLALERLRSALVFDLQM